MGKRAETEKRSDKGQGRGPKYGRRLGKTGIIGIWVLLALSGCSGQELEACDFVSVLTIPEGDTERLIAERQRKNSRTLDYSHTKAVILDTDLAQNPEELDKILECLVSRPEFAWNLLIFTGEKEVLQKAEEEKEKLGLELAAYYKNRRSPVTLLDFWNWRTGVSGELQLPVLVCQEDSLIPEGFLTI